MTNNFANTLKKHRRSIGWIIMFILAAIPAILITSDYYNKYIAPKNEIPQPFSIDKSLDKPISFDKFLNITDISFNDNLDKLESSEFNQSKYEFGDNIKFTFKLRRTTDIPRKLSVFIIDNNNYIRMSIPDLRAEYISEMLSANKSFCDIMNNLLDEEFFVDKPVDIDFSIVKTDSIVNYGTYRVVVIIWNVENSTLYSPSLILTGTTSIGDQEQNFFDFNTVSFLAFVLTITIALISGSIAIVLFRKDEDKKSLPNSNDMQTFIFFKLNEILKQKSEIVLDYSVKSCIRFITKKLDIFNGLGNDWTPTKRILLFQFINAKDSLNLYLHIGPGDDATRKKIYNTAKRKPDIFNKTSANLSPKYAAIYKKIILHKEDYEKDKEQIISIINEKINEFLNQDLPKIEHEITLQNIAH